MSFFYNILVYIASFFLKILALINPKIKLFVAGRKETFVKIASIKKQDAVIWLHVASLGEFEQGRPILEKLKEQYPNYKIVVTFFSPSGYTVRKNYPIADVVCYLPLDTKENMKRFVAQIHPKIVILVKYEFWFNMLAELQKKEIPTILISGVFRERQAFFKFYGGWMRGKLNAFQHFFVQDRTSKELLNSISFDNVTVAGDTRFDRVYKILEQNSKLDSIEEFKNNSYTIVAGSTWQEDEVLLVNYINNTALKEEKFIIAPHTINQKNIERLQQSILKKTILYSERHQVNLKEYSVFIIDTIGILTTIYRYANVAYVGGGFKTGLHNILEPAVFGIPVVFGGNTLYKKFKEAVDLVEEKGCVKIQNQHEFSSTFVKLKQNTTFREQMGYVNGNYIKKNIGATDKVLKYLTKQLH